MVSLGYALSSEEHAPNVLVRNARRAEEIGFEFASISDHFHPWISKQGNSSFVWSVLGGIAYATERLKVLTGVTCPIIRIHPAIIAQAAATVGCMMPGRFLLGLGTGENLNEHVTGEPWPPYGTRAEMLAESIEIIRALWQGSNQTYYGDFYDVINAEIYNIPDQLPPIIIAAAGEKSGELAATMGDGLINTSPDREVVEAFNGAGGASLPKYGQVKVCCGKDEREAVKTAHEWWPTAAMQGPVNYELPLPLHFEQVAKGVKEEDIAKEIICGNDVQRHLDAIQAYIDAGFDHVYIHQIGPDQDGFFEFYEKSILPEFAGMRQS